MAVHPRFGPDAQKARPSQDETESSRVDKPFAVGPQREIEQVAEMLAKAGGGALSRDLALDLVLNQLVEQVRRETRATGAVIALERDGEMICRATTGNAPELGVRVAASDLSAACVGTKEVQLCSDTDVDPRVDAEACRRLGVRSMLIAPITGKKETVGIIEVFSAKPNAFSEQEIKTLEALAGKISDSVEATEENVKTPPIVAKESDAFSQKLQALSEPTTTVQVEDSPEIAEEPQKRDVLTTILVMAVIAVSLLLGLLLGVRFGINGAGRGKQAHSGEASSNGAHAPSAASGQYKAASSADSVTQKTSSSAKAVAHSSGGLTVTENGKVIYRAGPSEEAAQTEGASSGPVHRIDPQYPEAARSRRIEGPVVLNAQILEDGTVGTINIVQGDPILAEAATQAVKQWKYRPNIVGGRPVTRQETITVTFKLPSS